MICFTNTKDSRVCEIQPRVCEVQPSDPGNPVCLTDDKVDGIHTSSDTQSPECHYRMRYLSVKRPLDSIHSFRLMSNSLRQMAGRPRTTRRKQSVKRPLVTNLKLFKLHGVLLSAVLALLLETAVSSGFDDPEKQWTLRAEKVYQSCLPWTSSSQLQVQYKENGHRGNNAFSGVYNLEYCHLNETCDVARYFRIEGVTEHDETNNRFKIKAEYPDCIEMILCGLRNRWIYYGCPDCNGSGIVSTLCIFSYTCRTCRGEAPAHRGDTLRFITFLLSNPRIDISGPIRHSLEGVVEAAREAPERTFRQTLATATGHQLPSQLYCDWIQDGVIDEFNQNTAPHAVAGQVQEPEEVRRRLGQRLMDRLSCAESKESQT